MEIYFATKEENNKRRQEEFLALTPGERLEAFLKMISKPSIFAIPDDYKHPNDEKNNFVIKKMMEQNFDDNVYDFIKSCNNYGVKMILVGGCAVNFYGYKRHSADVDFWIDNSQLNFTMLVSALQDIGYHLDKLPEQVLCGEQNISLKFSPDLEIELITRFNPGKTFDEALNESVEYVAKDQPFLKWNIISLDGLIMSKIKSGRPKDLMDVLELQKINKT